MKITNETAWDTRGLRAAILACERWLGAKGKWSRRVTFDYSRSGATTGYAYYHGGSITIHAPTPYPVAKRRRVFGALPDGTPGVVWRAEARPARVDEAGVLLPAYAPDFFWTVEHEMLHTLDWTHERMRREKHPAYRSYAAKEIPAWAAGITIRTVPTAVARPKATPEVAAEARAAKMRDRAEKDIEALARWQRKLKLANTKVKGLLRKIAARERRTAAREP